MDIEIAKTLLSRMAEDAYEEGDFARCLEIIEQLGDPLPPPLQPVVAGAAYKRAARLAATNEFPQARALLARARNLGDRATRRLCEERLRLMVKAPNILPLPEGSCPLCTRNPVVRRSHWAVDSLAPAVDEVYCVGAYRSGWDPERGNPFSEALRLLKEPGGERCLDMLGSLLAHFVAVHLGADVRSRVDLIAPVPTNPERFLKRGYCIPETLANHVAQQTAIPAYRELIAVKRSAPELRGLSRAERRDALKGVYHIADSELVKGRSVMIVDDIITHGTTLQTVGRLLRKAGAQGIIGVALAHTESSGRDYGPE